MLEAVIIICGSLLAVDGDTIKCGSTNMRLLGNGVPFISGIDTPELGGRAKCYHERELGIAAKKLLQQWLDKDDVVVVHSGSIDNFDRPLVNLYNKNGEELGQKLLSLGMAKVWKRGKKIDWCNSF